MLSTPPLSLSIVVPARDNHHLTRCCLESVARAARGMAVEVMVVDDGSRVPVREALRELGADFRVLRHATAMGFADAVNAGIAATEGQVVLLLNNDAELEADALRALIGAFERDDRLGVAGARLHYPDGAPQWCGGRQPTLTWLFALASGLGKTLGRLPGYRRFRPVHRRAQEVDWVSGAALSLRREVLAEVGGFDPSLGVYAQDLDLCVRAKQEGWRIQVLPEVRVRHHHGATIVGSENEGAASERPEQLWTSLLAWSHKHDGPSAGRRARLALVFGGRLRLVARALMRPLISSSRRAAWDRETTSYRAALRAAAAYDAGLARPPARSLDAAPARSVAAVRQIVGSSRRLDEPRRSKAARSAS